MRYVCATFLLFSMRLVLFYHFLCQWMFDRVRKREKIPALSGIKSALNVIEFD